MHSGMQGVVCEFGVGFNWLRQLPETAFHCIAPSAAVEFEKARSVRDELLKACLKKEES